MIELPVYVEKLVNFLKEHDPIVHNFNIEENQTVYDIPLIQQNINLNNFNYNLVIDTNIFHFLIRASQGKVNNKTRGAVALVAFCQLADINIEPSLALYEFINQDNGRSHEAVDKLMIFDRINNTETDELALFALGHKTFLNLANLINRNREEVTARLNEYRRLREWDSMYLLVLFVVKTDLSRKSNGEKLDAVLEWMIYNFRKSLPVLVFCIIYFGISPLKKMMKYKQNNSVQERKKQVYNMTWDIFIINHFFRTWTIANPLVETMYASDDIGLKAILRLAIRVQYTQDITPLRNKLSDTEFNKVKSWLESDYKEEERINKVTDDPFAYRVKLINQLEIELGLNG